MKTRQLKITAVIVSAALYLSSMTALAAGPSPFVGHWEGIDIDGSDIRLTIGGPPSGPFQITWTESYISFCNGEAGIVKGFGWLSADNPLLLEADLHVECFTTGEALDFHIVWEFHLDENILTGGDITWYRPGDPRLSPQSRLAVYLVDDFVIGWDWPRGAKVKLTINNPTNGPSTDLIQMTEVVPTPFSSDIWWARFDLAGIYKFKAGDVVKLSSKGVTKEHIVLPLTVDTVDGEQDYAEGTANPGTQIFVHPWDALYEPVVADHSGSWYMDFAGLYDLAPGVGGITEVFDEDNDSTAIDWIMMGLRVNYGHDWVESFYEEGHEVSIRVTDEFGEEKAIASVITEPKDFWGGESGFQTTEWNWHPSQPDLQPGDWVYAEVDNGVTAKVQIGDIQGSVDVGDDSVSGTIKASWIEGPVDVECLDWGSGGDAGNQDGGSILTNGVDLFSCAWDSDVWDIQPWQDIGVGYLTPDGHWVANAFRGEYWVAIWTYDYPGMWAEGDHSYYMQWEYTLPVPGDGHVMDPVYFNVTSSAFEFPGYALLYSHAALTPLVWNGESCEVSTSIHPNQATRFGWGWVNDYSMTYEEAADHFSSFDIQVFWDGEPGGSAVMAQGDLVPWYGPGTSDDYRCSLTVTP